MTITIIYDIIFLNGGVIMAVGKDKIGVLVNMDKELKSKLESIAKDDGRSLTNLINKILTDYVEDTHK